MNFFTHFYFEQPEQNPEFVAGLTIPDLFKEYSAAYRKIALGNAAYSNEKGLVFAGIKAHIEADKFFHNSDFFKVCNEYIKIKLSEIDRFERNFFLSHLFIELMLDRVLIKQNPDLAVLYYRILNSFDFKIFEQLMKTINTTVNPSVLWERFIHFINSRYLLHYTNNEKWLYALSRVYYRTIRKPHQKSFDKLADFIPSAEIYIEKRLNLLF